jgi:putative tricarboxylic transport membrane protein
MTEPRPIEPTAEPELTFWERWGELLVAAGVIILGIVVLVETRDIRITRAVARVSPRAIPQIVGAGLVVVGLWYAVDIIRSPHLPGGGEDSEDVDLAAETDWRAIVIIAVGLVFYAALMKPAGFVVASAVLYLLSTFAMGSHRYLRNALIGIVLAVVVYYVFDGWLGVRLPTGWLDLPDGASIA